MWLLSWHIHIAVCAFQLCQWLVVHGGNWAGLSIGIPPSLTQRLHTSFPRNNPPLCLPASAQSSWKYITHKTLVNFDVLFCICAKSYSSHLFPRHRQKEVFLWDRGGRQLASVGGTQNPRLGIGYISNAKLNFTLTMCSSRSSTWKSWFYLCFKICEVSWNMRFLTSGCNILSAMWRLQYFATFLWLLCE